MGRRVCCDKSKVKRGSWSPQEDDTLKNYIHNHGGTAGSWIALPHKAGLQRCGKSCRLRWLNYLRPNIKHGNFTHDEDFIISSLFNKIGSRWSIIASNLAGRTDNEVKNYWNTKLKKKYMAQFDWYATPPPNNKEAEKAATATSRIVATNLQEAMPYVYDGPTPSVSNDPIKFSSCPSFLLEGSRGNFPYSPSLQDSSPFGVGMHEDSGVKMKLEEHSCEVVSGIWVKEEEEAIGANCNADLFSIFQGLSQSH